MPHEVLKIGGYVDVRPDDLTGRPDMDRHQRKRIRRYFRGVCRSCNQPPLPGTQLCQRHTEMAREASRKSYQKSKAKHLHLYGMSRHRLEWLRARRVDVQARLLVG